MANSMKRSEKNKKGYLKYKTEGRLVRNKTKRLKRQLKNHPNDTTNPFHPKCKHKPEWMAIGV